MDQVLRRKQVFARAVREQELVETRVSRAEQAYAVEITDQAFRPLSLYVPVGARVTWVNRDTVPHTITADRESTHGLNFGPLEAGGQVSHVFTSPGTFRYHCAFYPQMWASLTVL